MSNKLEQLRKLVTVVADTGEISEIKKYKPKDATTNPSLILKAVKNRNYEALLYQAIKYGKIQGNNKSEKIQCTCDILTVKIGEEILKTIPGRISTEVDARLSYDTYRSIEKARKLIKIYNNLGISNNRILIKLAATWEGIRAAEQLEKEGINCNLTLVFSFAQARACAEANVFLISPFVGRIMDWYERKEGHDCKTKIDPGVLSVSNIYSYYKEYSYKTIIMGASFRNTKQILELAGCDALTIPPQLLKQLESEKGKVTRKLVKSIHENNSKKRPVSMTHSEFLWEHNNDPMAVEKLTEGIRNFSIDQKQLEMIIEDRL
ncbi:transaldolase [Candidatus Photodesmus katoptron]|uniref:Transaldolase n=1 Tax=Candidatus Photodesmus katoptron Akat1 TaxID=1236703 RepID=S3E070_9GAMM|nr:transaldolase [Candidatus Photodesmus katoptron]EPE37601.1 transaldolase [Candidatus Photodesmus katoptron Akat1]KEY90681.1 transaldolase [Candidatus Photodesmus katoptron]